MSIEEKLPQANENREQLKNRLYVALDLIRNLADRISPDQLDSIERLAESIAKPPVYSNTCSGI